MDLLNELYYKSVSENEKNLRFWEEYLQKLKTLDFSVYSEKLKVPVLVPIGSRILFRGELKHTNEVTVALGADYFVKCSLKQADVLRQHRIKGAQEKVDVYNKEKDYLQNQMSFTKQNVYDNQGQEIIEYHTDEEDKAWREKHKANVKEYMQKRGKERELEKPREDMTDEELWNRLEELELQEELENELNSVNYDSISLTSIKKSNKESFVVKEEADIKVKHFETEDDQNEKDNDKAEKEKRNKKVTFQEARATEQPSKLDLLQKVIDRQNELDEKLQELKNRDRTQSKTEKDLMSRLDEMEQLDELEDEMDRLDDIIENEDSDTEESEIDQEEDESNKSDPAKKLQRRVSFVDEDDSETLNLTFKHSETEPNNDPYDPEKGIQKPSDIYSAYSNVFGSGKTSILKRSKYATDDEVPEMLTGNPILNVQKAPKKQAKPSESLLDSQKHDVTQTIVIKDVVEKEGQGAKLQSETKPMSLFKKKRMQNKS